jgi:hypothetical protein
MGDVLVRCRALGVLALVLGLTAPVVRLAAPVTRPGAATVDAALACVLAWMLVACWAWLGFVAALMALEALATGGVRRSSQLAPRLVRTLVTAACGAGLAAGLAAPALADTTGTLSEVHLLDGLALPDRTPGMPSAPTTACLVVQPGDTLFDLARAHGTTWPALYRANREAIGSDPDLIEPGTRLTLPSARVGSPR